MPYAVVAVHHHQQPPHRADPHPVGVAACLGAMSPVLGTRPARAIIRSSSIRSSARSLESSAFPQPVHQFGVVAVRLRYRPSTLGPGNLPASFPPHRATGCPHSRERAWTTRVRRQSRCAAPARPASGARGPPRDALLRHRPERLLDSGRRLAFRGAESDAHAPHGPQRARGRRKSCPKQTSDAGRKMIATACSQAGVVSRSSQVGQRHPRWNMSHLLSRACTMLVVIAGVGIGGCSSPSGPSAIPSSTQAPGAGVGLSSARRVIGAVAVCTGQGTHRPNAREGWLDLPDPAQSDPLRTSRTGLATDSAPSRQWRRAELPPHGVHPRPPAA